MAKKYYWLKLKEDFFDDDAIGWLEEHPKGKEYALFYLKLCLKSLKTDGLLIRNVGTILVPYDMKKLSEITKTDFDTVVVAMELLKNIGLIEILEKGGIYLPRLQDMVGSETDKAQLMRKKRLQDKYSEGDESNIVTELLPDSYSCSISNNVTGMLPNCYTEIRDKEIENRDRDKEIEKEIDKIIVEPTGSTKKNDVGEFEYQCVEILIGSCLSNFPKSKVPKDIDEKLKWAAEIERMKRIDERTEADIIEALTYATTDSFWKTNIRSTKKLREKFETLIIQSRDKSRKPATNSGGDPLKRMLERGDFD